MHVDVNIPVALHYTALCLISAQKMCDVCTPGPQPPIAIETSGVFGSETSKFLKELGHRLKQTSGECNAYSCLPQRLSVAVQRGNATSVMSSVARMQWKTFFYMHSSFTKFPYYIIVQLKFFLF